MPTETVKNTWEKAAKRPSSATTAPDYSELFANVVELAADYYWEMDRDLRFTLVVSRDGRSTEPTREFYFGRTSAEIGCGAPGDPELQRHAAIHAAREPYSDLLIWLPDPAQGVRYYSVTGRPMFTDGKFAGYRGVSRDVTARVCHEQRITIEHGVATLLASAVSTAQAIPAIIELLCKTMDWSCGSWWTLDASAGELQCEAAWGADSPLLRDFLARTRAMRVPVGNSRELVVSAWQGADPVWRNELTPANCALRWPEADRAGLGSGLAFAMQAPGATIGVLEFHAPVIHAPGDELNTALRFITDQLALFAQRKAAEERLRESENLYQSTVRVAAVGIAHVSSDGHYLYVNQRACELLGYEAQELLRMTVKDVSHPDDQSVTDEVRADLHAGRLDHFKMEKRYIHKNGSVVWVALTIAVKRSANGAPEYDISIIDDISARKVAELATQRLSRMVATLNATNEALLRVESPSELYEDICNAAASAGDFHLAAALLADVAGSLTIAALRGPAADRIAPHGHAVAGAARGWGLGDIAYRMRVPCVSNDLLGDDRIETWHDGIRAFGFASGAAVPLIRGRRCIGALLLFHHELNTFDDDTMALLKRLAANVAYELDNFDRDAERARAEIALRESEERFRSLTELSSDWYWEQDARLCFSRIECPRDSEGWGDFIRQRLGRSGWDPRDELEIDPATGWDWFRATLDAHQPFRDIVMFRGENDASRRYMSVSGQPMFDRDGRFTGYRGVGHDVSERKQSEERIRYLATHDGLTGLPNRAMFSQMLAHSIETARRYRRAFAVQFIDLDRFKLINDSLGHQAGDLLLKEMSTRFRGCLRAGDVIARLGGDEFVVLLPETGDSTEAAAVARKLLTAAIAPFSIGGQEFRVTASVGICLYPTDASDEQTLMKNADIAMYLAKEEGKNNYQFYEPGIRSQSIERLRIESSLRTALERGEFLLNYQPKVDFKTGGICGVEALLRWNSAELGQVSPAQFIPIAEDTGLIVSIGKWVLRTACAQSVGWQREGLPVVNMAVNLSVRQFNDKDLLIDISEIIADTGISPETLELEITEGMVIQNPQRAIELLTAISRMGIRLAIDDFGTGYSSLGQLKNFPIDTLKIDRSFIREVPHDNEDRAITEAIIAMGKILSLTVVAEGVETPEQAAFLQSQNCDQMQGYYFSKPVPASEMEKLLRSRTGNP